MLPITIVFFLTGFAVWSNFLYFLGVGAKPQEGGPDPLRSVGWITLVAGIVDLGQAAYIMGARPKPPGDPNSIPLAGLIAIYGAFFTYLGVTEIAGLDLRPLGNFSFAVAIVPLFFWKFFAGGWMFRSILVVWAIVFLAITATTYGRFNPKALAGLLFVTAAYTFWTPAVILALGKTIP